MSKPFLYLSSTLSGRPYKLFIGHRGVYHSNLSKQDPSIQFKYLLKFRYLLLTINHTYIHDFTTLHIYATKLYRQYRLYTINKHMSTIKIIWVFLNIANSHLTLVLVI